jgi:hypothetical protein
MVAVWEKISGSGLVTRVLVGFCLIGSQSYDEDWAEFVAEKEAKRYFSR